MSDDYGIEDFDPETDIAPEGQAEDAEGNADCDGGGDEHEG